MTMDIVYYNKKSLICEKEEKMKVLNFKTKSFRKIPNPFYNLNNYMETNPRKQKLTTAVAKKNKGIIT